MARNADATDSLNGSLGGGAGWPGLRLEEVDMRKGSKNQVL